MNQGQASQASPAHREGKHRAPPRRMPEIPTRDDFDGSPSALAVREKETELRLGNRWRDVQVRLAHRALDGGPALAQHLEYFAPKSEADIAAMERLVDWVLAGNAEPVPRTQLAADPVEARVRQVNILCETLRARLPELVARKDAKRMAEVLLYLVRNEVSSRALDSAISMAWFRDSCAQLSASAVAYSASFGIFNGILAALMDRYGGDEHQLDPRYYLIPGLVMPVTAMVASRVLRQGEMLPGWTLPTEADSKGMPVAAINTWSGYFRVATQFLSFFGSLGYAARNYSDRLEQVQARIYGGYLATAGVVLHRMMFLRNRDFPWLKAKDDLEGRAMVGTIRELNGTPGAGQVPAPDWRDTGRSLSGAVSAYPARMATGLASLGPRDETTLGSLDMLGRLEDERAMRPAGAAPLPPRRPARVGEEVCHSFSRLVCLLVPLGITYFGFSKLAGDAAEAMTSEQRLQLALAAMVSATILIKTWGLGTASVEYRLGQDPSLQREKEAREARAREFMAYRSGIPVAQPAAAAARARDPLEIAVADGGRDLGRAGGLAEEVAAALPPARVVSAEEATRQRERKEAEGGSARRDGKGHRERVDG